MPKFGTISQIARRVENLDRARSFFRDTMGLTELYSFPGLAFYDLGGTRLMIRETGKCDDADILYFRVSNIAATHAEFAATGITFSQPPHIIHTHPDGTQETMAFFKDDEGRDLALHSVQKP